uniref:butyrophilin subfamily 2 member A1-like n=1 Tax=Monopterus albus TaxID=43700 RepID=UPI0009B4A218
SVSPPVLRISRLSGEDSGVLLRCESRGWYPEPELLWLDAEGNLLPAGPTETVPGPDGLYTVSGRATVEQRHGSSFTCRVQQSNTNQSRETHIQVADDLFTVTPSPVGRVLIVLAVCITCVLTFILAAFITGRQKTKNKLHHADETGQKEHETNTPDIQTERQAPMGSEGETSQLLVYRETESHVTWEKEKLDEELKRNDEELGDVLQIIKMLNEQKDDVKNHREKVCETLQEMIEKIKKDKKESENTKKQRRRAARDEILQKSDKLMKTTDEMILKMTEMKVRLEKDTEQVNKQLKKRDENQRKLLSEQSEREG